MNENKMETMPVNKLFILLPLASILGKAIGINGIWWSFLISETVTVILAVIYLGIAEKKEGVSMPEISLFYGIRVTMCYENHNPPHFHLLLFLAVNL